MTVPLSPLELMELQVTTLTVCTPDGRLLRENDSFGDEAAARFFLGRTTQGNLWRCRHDLPDELVAELEDLARSEPVCTDLARLPEEPAIASRAREALGRHAPITGEHRGPAYYVPPGVPVPDHAVPITDENLALLETSFPETAQALPRTAPCVVAVEQGAVVAVCFSSRLTDRAAEAGVETLEPHRRQGHGNRISGRFPGGEAAVERARVEAALAE
jgi:hypothetical protein